MKNWAALIVLAALPGFAAAEGMVCGNKIVERGSSREEVRAYCGKPAQIDNKTAYSGVAGLPGRNQRIVEGAAVEIQIETWIYNFGPDQLMEKVRFEDGIVASVESMGYGYNEP
jgi:Protein of unknown function (DUF2845)